jgi:hypothetical protein
MSDAIVVDVVVVFPCALEGAFVWLAGACFFDDGPASVAPLILLLLLLIPSFRAFHLHVHLLDMPSDN